MQGPVIGMAGGDNGVAATPIFQRDQHSQTTFMPAKHHCEITFVADAKASSPATMSPAASASRTPAVGAGRRRHRAGETVGTKIAGNGPAAHCMVKIRFDDTSQAVVSKPSAEVSGLAVAAGRGHRQRQRQRREHAHRRQ